MLKKMSPVAFRSIYLLLFVWMMPPLSEVLAQADGSTCPVIHWENEGNRSGSALNSTDPFDQLATFIAEDPHEDIQGVVVVKEGTLIYEANINGFDATTPHDIRSATKSIIGLLIGIAVDKELLSVDDTLLSFFPNAASDPQKEAIRVEDLLTMASGLNANADDDTTPGHENWLEEADDWIEFALGIPMAHDPGDVWWYASLNTFLLGVVLERATGMELEDFAQTYLFDALNINHYRWRFTPNGHVAAQGNFFVQSRDLAKIGQLMLNNGCWKGEQLVSNEWIRQSITGQYDVYWQGYDTYGYQWYNHMLEIGGKEYAYFFASGNGGQKLYVVPEEDLVVVIMTLAYNTRHGQRRSLDMFKMILEANGHLTNE